MRLRRLASSLQLCSAIFLSAVAGCAQAVELGEVAARSHVGQQLVADIELTALADPAALVRVALASPDVYRGASISMHPVLSSLNLSVMRRDGRQFLHITSIKPVETEYLHLFLELTEDDRRTLRGATIWLTPDPQPAPAPAPVAARAAVPVQAAPAHATAPAPLPAPMPRPAPGASAPPLRLAQATRPAVCPQRYSPEQIKACAALDYKNATLSAQIVELEAKVKQLQLAIGTSVGDAAAAPAALEKAAPAPAPPPAASKATPAGATPWLFIGIAGAAIGALAGVLALIMGRRRRALKDEPSAPVKTGFIMALKNRLMPGKGGADAPETAEPTAE